MILDSDPQMLGSCRIEERLATGEHSRIYRATDTGRQRTVIVKLFGPMTEDPTASARMLGASQRLFGVGSNHVVEVIRTAMDGDRPYVVFEHVDGEDIERAIQREGTFIAAAALRVVLDTAQGLSAAFLRGVLHQDVRPRHLLRMRGVTKVTGFSLSPPFSTAQGRRFFGHPWYVSPEVANGGRGDMQSDVYSLGATLFEILSGRPPYGTDGTDSVIAAHVHEAFPSLSSVGVRVPEGLERFLSRMVEKQPSARFRSYDELIHEGAALLPSVRRLMGAELTLVVEEGLQRGMRTPVPEGALLLGRTPGEGVQVDDARISRRHAILHRRGNDVEIEDLGSRNGIYVDGVQVASRTRRPLASGQRLEIGDTVLRIEGGASLPIEVRTGPSSPVRGAFGDVELIRAPGQQATADDLFRIEPKLSAHLADPNLGDVEQVLTGLRQVLGADHAICLRVENGRASADVGVDAQVLAAVLPAIERSLPGQLSVSTSVRVGERGSWAVVVAPVIRQGATESVIVVVMKGGAFGEAALATLEACCSLLARRRS